MKKTFVLSLIAAALCGQAFAATEADAARKAAATRYAEDKKLCAGESDAGTRMQCLRDAKSEYDKALAAAKAKTASASGKSCADCGKVASVQVEEKDGEGGALGTIAGGVAGALVGSQVGNGTGRDLATVAGAVGGAYAGHKIEGKMKKTKVWTVAVHFDNGESKSYHFDHDPGFAAGTAVKASGDTIVRR